jgi:hypothetical protein
MLFSPSIIEEVFVNRPARFPLSVFFTGLILFTAAIHLEAVPKA